MHNKTRRKTNNTSLIPGCLDYLRKMRIFYVSQMPVLCWNTKLKAMNPATQGSLLLSYALRQIRDVILKSENISWEESNGIQINLRWRTALKVTYKAIASSFTWINTRPACNLIRFPQFRDDTGCCWPISHFSESTSGSTDLQALILP